MNLWEYIGNIQKDMGNNVNTDVVPAKNGRIPFGVSLDTAKAVPAKTGNTVVQARFAPTRKITNEDVERLRVNVIKGFTKATEFAMKYTPLAVIPAIDEATKGGLSNALMSGAKNVRSNYAFVRGAADEEISKGMLAGLNLIAGGVSGAIAGAGLGAAAGLPFAGVGAGPGAIGGGIAGFIGGIATAGKVSRNIAKDETLGKGLKEKAIYAESAVGQEHYNFGKDVVTQLARIQGFKTLGDTSMGIGAVTSGLLNFGFEVGLDPLLKGTSVAGKTAKAALVGGVTPKSQGLVADFIGRTTGLRELELADKLEIDIDTIKKTAAGEATIYTPLFEFLKNNDAATVLNHPTLKNNDMGSVAASVLAGKSNEEIGLVLRIGRGDKSAIDELESNPNYADTYAELNRYESGIAALEQDGMIWFRHDNSLMMVGSKYQDGADLIKAEIEVLRKKKDFIERAVSLDSWLQTDRTVSQFAWVERMRADKAVRGAATKISGKTYNNELIDGVRQETEFGDIITSVYKNNLFSVPISFVSRLIDDAPHATVNFNEGVQSVTRVRTSLRDAVTRKVIDEKEALQILNDFIAAPTEGVKNEIIENYAKTVIRNAAINYGHHEDIAELAVNTYIKNHRLTKQEAMQAKEQNRAYMVGEDGTAMSDPQLITQLANGAYLPDIAIIDKAFKEFGTRPGAITKAGRSTLYGVKTALDELQAIWRGGTLARGGFTANILRDANFRAWADASMFSLYSQLGLSSLDAVTNGLNTVKKITSWEKDIISPKRNMRNIREAIDENDKVLKKLEGRLEQEGFYKKPRKGAKAAEITPALQRVIESRDTIAATLAELRRQEKAIVDNIPTQVIKRDKISVSGWDFPAPLSGQLGEISRQKLNGREEIRGALASVRELEMESVRRGSYGGKVYHAVDDEAEHLVAWTDMLNNHLRNDPLAIKIMEGEMGKPELMNWLQENSQRSYIDRFGLTVVEEGKPPRRLRRDDAEYIYDRVNFAVNSIAANEQVRKLVLNNQLTAIELKKLYPVVAERPPVSGDVTTNALGNGNLARRAVNLQKDVVQWLATQPTSRLNYNHYFAAKYYEKLETLVMNANERGVIPGAKQKVQYEKIARSYAINEYRSKINAFSKDMNFAGIMNYVIAFFPAVVEQFRAYGRIMIDNPELPIRLAYAAQIPEYIADTQEDAYGNRYIEYTMPYTGLKARFGVEWFNPINPTSGSILSAGPLATTAANLAAKQTDFADTKLGAFLLPFGVSTNNMSAYTPNTWRKASELYNAWKGNGEQFNKDVNMVSKQYLFDFIEDNDRQPNPSEMNQIQIRGEKDALALSVLKFVSSLTLPQQPKMRTAISFYQDRFNEAIKQDPINGAEEFMKDNPEYFMLADKLTNNLSGVRSDETAVALLQRNNLAVREIVTNVADLSALGAVFNDDNYAFSSSADAWLRTQKIPGLDSKYKASEASLLNMKSTVVNKGWTDWFKLIQVVSTEMKKPPYNLDPARGYGDVVLQQYKDAFIEQQKTENPMWYDEKINSSGGGDKGRMASVIKAVTIAANTPEMWKDLSQQPRWSAIVEYMNFRYQINDELKRRDVGYDTKSAIDLRNQVTLKVWELRNKDVKFGQFYDRYFDGDDFSVIFDYTPPKRSK
jgi:hypothetical protein